MRFRHFAIGLIGAAGFCTGALAQSASSSGENVAPQPLPVVATQPAADPVPVPPGTTNDPAVPISTIATHAPRPLDTPTSS